MCISDVLRKLYNVHSWEVCFDEVVRELPAWSHGSSHTMLFLYICLQMHIHLITT